LKKQTPSQHAKELIMKFYNLFKVELENSIHMEEAKAAAMLHCDLMEGNEEIFGDWYVQVKREIKKYRQ